MTDEEFKQLSKIVEETIASGNKLMDQARKLITERASVIRELKEVAAAQSSSGVLTSTNLWDQAEANVWEGQLSSEQSASGEFRSLDSESKPQLAKILAKRNRI